MRQAITTKYLGPTNRARVKATAPDGSSEVFPWLYDKSQEENHNRAAVLLAFRLGWVTQPSYSHLQGAWIPGEVGVWTVVERPPLKSALGLGTKEYWEGRLSQGDVSNKCLDDDDDRAAVAEVVASIFENGL